MKNIRLLLLFSSVFLSSCIYPGGGGDDDFTPQNLYEPVVMPRAEFESAVVVKPTQDISNSGKIYIKDNLLFINEFRKGFHVFNYSNPENPIAVGFIQIPGATDLAVRNNTIYINQAVDLVTLQYSISDNSLTVTNRNRNIFPQMIAPNGEYHNAPNEQIIIDFTQ